MFQKMPFLLIFIIVSVFLGGGFLPVSLQSALYASSLTIKSLIAFLLPFIIFGLLFRASVLMARKATWIVGIILISVCLSTFIAVFLARFVGILAYNISGAVSFPESAQALCPLWHFEFPTFIGNDKAMIAAFILGTIGSLYAPNWAIRMSETVEGLVMKALSVVTYLIPLFVAGFVVKLRYEGIIGTILKNYSVIFTLIAVAQFAYLYVAYFLIEKGSIKRSLISLQNLMPAVISGFSTMSSAASMPLLLKGVGKNTKYKELNKIVVPAIVNIHMVGECFTSVILAYAIAKTYGVAMPSLLTYFWFACDFFIARFFVAAIPGGGILVVYHLLRQYFGFNDDMISLITALYILFDPFLTVGNVLGDGALAQLIDRIVDKMPKLTRGLSEEKV